MSPVQQYENCRKQVILDIRQVSDGNDQEHFDVASLRPSFDHRSVVGKQIRLWPGAQIPTRIEDDFTEEQILRLSCAMKYFEAYTCVRFVKWNTSYEDYLYITKNDIRKGCFSQEIGRNGGRQILNLDAADLHCAKHGIIIHELMHVLGFFHEQARDDRDEYISVNWENIPDQYEYQFKTASQLGMEQKLIGDYDYASIMHYGRFIWHLHNPTMTAKQEPSIQYKFNEMMGNRDKPTDMDTHKINKLYCPEDKDCIVSAWLTEGECAVTCGGGRQVRKRIVLKDAQTNGAKCPSLNETVACINQPCPIDCQVSDWTPKSVCSASCDGGKQTLQRSIVREPNSYGTPCPPLESLVVCHAKPCPSAEHFMPDCIDVNVVLGENINDLLNNDATRVAFIILYAFVICCGVVGNVYIIVTVARSPDLRTVRNLFLLNIAVVHVVLLTVCGTITPISAFQKQWSFGEFLCHLVPFLQVAVISIVPCSSTVIAIDRYIQIVRPSIAPIPPGMAMVILVVLWIVSSSLAVPMAVKQQLKTISPLCGVFCMEKWSNERDRRIYSLALLALQFFVPVLTITVCYVSIYFKLKKSANALCAKTRTVRKYQEKDSTAVGLIAQDYAKRQANLDQCKRTNRILVSMVAAFLVCCLPQALVSSTLQDFQLLPQIFRQPSLLCVCASALDRPDQHVLHADFVRAAL